MEPTMLYNGVHLQRKKRFTLSPRHNLNSNIQIDWPESFHHEETSPLQKIKKRQSMEVRKVGEKHNSFVGSYLAQTLNLTDSRLIRYQQNCEEDSRRFQNLHFSKNQKTNDRSLNFSDTLPSNPFKLPKLSKDEIPSKRNNILSQLITDRSNSYFNRMLRQKLKKYDLQR